MSGNVIGRLSEFGYEGVTFPVVSAESDAGQDAVLHEAHGRDGADIEPVGAKPQRGTFKIACLDGLAQPYGNVFSDKYFDIMRAFATKPLGELTHPTRGVFTALISDYKETLDPNVRNGVFIDVTWVEHNASAGIQAIPSSEGDVAAAATDADVAEAAVNAALAAQ